jgi:serine O-acetyltransferase
LLVIHAIAHWLLRHRVPLLPKLLTSFNRVVFAVQLPAGTRLGRGVKLNYSGLGTVLHARVVVGDRVEIGPGVVIGGRSKIHEVPVIEDDVLIGVGAKILGPVRVPRTRTTRPITVSSSCSTTPRCWRRCEPSRVTRPSRYSVPRRSWRRSSTGCPTP